MVDPFQVIQSTATPAAVIDDQGRLLAINRPAEVMFGHDLADLAGRYCHEVFQGEDIFGNVFCQENCNILTMMNCQQPISCFEMRVRASNGEFLRVSVSTLVFPDDESGRFKQVHLFQPLAESQRKRSREGRSRPTGEGPEINGTWRAGNRGHANGQGNGNRHANGQGNGNRHANGQGNGNRHAYDHGNGNGHGYGTAPEIQPDTMRLVTDGFGLTGREVEILRFLAHGKNSKDICAALSISMSTVRNHLRNCFQKLDVHSQSEAVSYVLRNGIV